MQEILNFLLIFQSCEPCNNIAPCPQCQSDEECHQLYPNACYACPQNVCISTKEKPDLVAPTVGGTVGGTIILVTAIAVLWCMWRRGREKTRFLDEAGEEGTVQHVRAKNMVNQLTEVNQKQTLLEQRVSQNFDAIPIALISKPVEMESATPSDSLPTIKHELWRISEQTERSSTTE